MLLQLMESRFMKQDGSAERYFAVFLLGMKRVGQYIYEQRTGINRSYDL